MKTGGQIDLHAHGVGHGLAANRILFDVLTQVPRAALVVRDELQGAPQVEFTRMLRQLVTANNELSRAPSDLGREA